MIEYTIHEQSPYIQPHYSDDQGTIENFLNLARSAAIDALESSKAKHAIYGVKFYDEHFLLCKADIYCPAILLDDNEFAKRTDAQFRDSPNCYILAVHLTA